MFRLKKLDIQGFKSFVDKTSVTLPTRITAIVGPNGSGKSNICDAVQWVLGEQSARNLRGTTMEDVIFNGAARRRPLGMAEVTITLESRSGEEWAETGGEVTIARRVTRDGESDYILNGKRSRLKDVQEILLGTGLGVRAYSIIEQQKIDLILSTKPQDRRRLIEEAAGVSKYKIRKRQAEVKLEETRGNLLRLTDIVSEIDRTCASLKRQASRAARWKEQADVLAAQKRRLARLRADRLASGFAEGEKALAAATDAEAAALAELGRLEAELTEARRLADEDERAVREAGDAFARAREALLAAEAAAAAAAREAEEAAARRELLETQKKETEADHVRFVEEAGRGAKSREEAEAELARADEAARKAAEALLVRRREGDGRHGPPRGHPPRPPRRVRPLGRGREPRARDRAPRGPPRLRPREARGAEGPGRRGPRGPPRGRRGGGARRRVRLRDARRGAREARERDARPQRRRGAARRPEEHPRSARRVLSRRRGPDRRPRDDARRRARRAASPRAARSRPRASPPPASSRTTSTPPPGYETALDAALGAALEAPVLESRGALDAALRAVREGKLGTARFVHPLAGHALPAEARRPARQGHREGAPLAEVREGARLPRSPTRSSSRTSTTRSRSRPCTRSGRS